MVSSPLALRLKSEMIDARTRLGYLLWSSGVFYFSYGLTNFLTSLREDVPEIVFDWEWDIPFLAWTIIPYWSLNLLYIFPFFLCQFRAQLRNYATRLLLGQSIAIIGFLFFPLQNTWIRPETGGVFGFLFQSLESFDQPYNQAPSLHIILTIVVGGFYWRLLPKYRLLLCLWLGVIAFSILTTYQHHFLDLPTGALVGFLVMWLLPENGISPIFVKQSQNLVAYHRRLIGFYSIGMVIFALLAFWGGVWLWSLWDSLSLGLVAFAYWRGVLIFQKKPDGKLTSASYLLLLPYLIGAGLNIVYWLYGKQKSSLVFGGVSVGSILASCEFDAVLDCCGELPITAPKIYEQALMLDLVPPSVDELCKAAEKLDRLQRENDRVLVACALGYGRSVAVVLTWLLATRKVEELNEAIFLMKNARQKIMLSDYVLHQIERASQAFQARRVCE